MKVFSLLVVILMFISITVPSMALSNTITTGATISRDLLYNDEVRKVSIWNIDKKLYRELISTEHYNYNIEDIDAVVEAKLSLVTRFSASVLEMANLINDVFDYALTFTEDGVQELIIGTIGSVVSSSGEKGKLVVTFYETAEFAKDYKDIQKLKSLAETTEDLANVSKKTSTLAIDVAAYILKQEMEYINNNMNKAFVDLWKFNYGSTDKLLIYAVHIDKIHDEKKLHEKGIRYFYFNEDTNSYVNYYNNLVFTKIDHTTEVQENGLYGLWRYQSTSSHLDIDQEKMHYYYGTSKGSYMYYNVLNYDKSMPKWTIEVYKTKYLSSGYEYNNSYVYEIIVNGDILYFKRKGHSNASRWKRVQ